MKTSWFAIITILSFVLVTVLTFSLAKAFAASPVETPDPDTQVRTPSVLFVSGLFVKAGVPVSANQVNRNDASITVEKPEPAPAILPTALAAQNTTAGVRMDIAKAAGVVTRAFDKAWVGVRSPVVSVPDADEPAAAQVVLEVPEVDAAVETAAAPEAAAAQEFAADTLVFETADGVRLADFAASVINGDAGQVVGVFSPDLFALPVVQQPWNQANFVSTNNGEVTQFNMPKTHGVTGLLAHNYLSGQRFFELSAGESLSVVYGDGRIERYAVTVSRSFQALSPNSPYSDFVDVADPGEQKLSSADLFKQVYTTAGQLVLQTCIDAYGDPSWGRLFVIAEKVTQ